MFRVNWEKWFKISLEKKELDKDKIILVEKIVTYKPCLGDFSKIDRKIVESYLRFGRLYEEDLEALFKDGYSFWKMDQRKKRL